MGVNIPWYIDPLPIVYIDPLTNGISTPLPYTIIDFGDIPSVGGQKFQKISKFEN
jgi:hypothetical protein